MRRMVANQRFTVEHYHAARTKDTIRASAHVKPLWTAHLSDSIHSIGRQIAGKSPKHTLYRSNHALNSF
jgi:hypothetical protein